METSDLSAEFRAKKGKVYVPSVESITPSQNPPSFSIGTQHDLFGSYG